MRRFTQEARTASALSHPNVAHIYEIGEEAGVRFPSVCFSTEQISFFSISSIDIGGGVPADSRAEFEIPRMRSRKACAPIATPGADKVSRNSPLLRATATSAGDALVWLKEYFHSIIP